MNLSLLITIDRGECAHDECGQCPYRLRLWDTLQFCENKSLEYEQVQKIINGKRTKACLAAEVKDERS